MQTLFNSISLIFIHFNSTFLHKGVKNLNKITIFFYPYTHYLLLKTTKCKIENGNFLFFIQLSWCDKHFSIFMVWLLQKSGKNKKGIFFLPQTINWFDKNKNWIHLIYFIIAFNSITKDFYVMKIKSSNINWISCDILSMDFLLKKFIK